MKSQKGKIGMVLAAVVGCGICCLPLLSPLIAGSALASLWALHSGEIICLGIALLIFALGGGYWLFKKPKMACELPSTKRI